MRQAHPARMGTALGCLLPLSAVAGEDPTGAGGVAESLLPALGKRRKASSKGLKQSWCGVSLCVSPHRVLGWGCGEWNLLNPCCALPSLSLCSTALWTRWWLGQASAS